MVPEIAAFAFATAGESIYPGPTIATLVAARTRGRQEAWGVVIGVALANILWVVAVVLLKNVFESDTALAEVQPAVKAIGAGILVFMATRAAVAAAIDGIEAYILKTWSAPVTDTLGFDAKSFGSAVVRGAVVHFSNPLSLAYYFGSYAGTLAKDPSLALLFSVVAVAVDFLLYGIFASLPVGKLLRPLPIFVVARRALGLVAGFAMLFLVARVFVQDSDQHDVNQLHGFRDCLMALGLMAGGVWVAEDFAARYGGKKIKLLWRGIFVWQSAFAIFTVIGTVLSLVGRISPDSMGFDKSHLPAISICSLVAAVATAALSYVRAKGEMLDEAALATDTHGQYLPRMRALNTWWFIFPVFGAGFVLLYVFFDVTGF
jgi:hypothetical protein